MNKLLLKAIYALVYLGNPGWDSDETPPEVLAVIENHPAGKALDLGCGTGTHAITLAQHGWSATGVDFIPKAVRAARRKARLANLQVDFYQQDVTDLDNLDAPYDFILDVGCYHGLDHGKRKTYRQNLHTLLADGGIYLTFAFLTGGEHRSFCLTEAGIQKLSNGFEVLSRTDGMHGNRQPMTWLKLRKK